MPAEIAAALVIWALLCAAAYFLGAGFGKRGEPMRDWLSTRVHSRRRPTTQARPIEAIAVDLHRLGHRFHSLDPGTSFAKTEAVRTAYDRALAECCAALGLSQLLGVLPAGSELDAERERVEEQLTHAGVRLPHAA